MVPPKMEEDWSAQGVKISPNSHTFMVPFCVPPIVPPTPQRRGTVLHAAPSTRIGELSPDLDNMMRKAKEKWECKP